MLASGLGLLDGRGLLGALTVVNLLGFVATAAATAMISQRQSQSSWLFLAALLNVGLWLSLQVTTADVFAMGLATMGLAFTLSSRHVPAIWLLVAATLAKETYVVIPIALSAWLGFEMRNRRAALSYLAPILPLAAWYAYVALRLGETGANGEALDWPFFGLMNAATSSWTTASPRDQLFTILSLGILGLGAVATARTVKSVWRFLLVPWLVVAAVSSHWIWDLGNNSLRVMAPLLTLSILALAGRRERAQARSSLKNLPV
jgi:hypothetical protein